MLSEDLLSYIRNGIQAGQSRDDITLNLVTSGWVGEDIDEAFRQIQNNDSANLPKQNNSKVENQFPSVVNLFKESWTLFKSTFVPFLKLLGLFTVFFLVLIILGAMIAFILSVFHVNPFDKNISNVTSVAKTFLTIIIVLITLIFLAFFVLVIAPVIQISNIILLNSQGTLSIRSIIKNSRSMAIPFFLAIVLSGFIINGGILALLFPGIYFATIFIFVPYVVVLEDKKGTDALRSSYSMVKGRFWQIFFRIIAIYVIVYALSFIMQLISKDIPVFTIISVIFNIFINWFVACYMFLLYRHVKALPIFPGTIRMRGIWVTAVFGMVLAPLLLAVTLIAINPKKQFAQSNDTKRRSDVSALLNAVSYYDQDHGGMVNTKIDSASREISKSGVDICSDLVSKYIGELPVDPDINKGVSIKDCTTDYTTGYLIQRNGSGRITISAPKGELDKNISANR